MNNQEQLREEQEKEKLKKQEVQYKECTVKEFSEVFNLCTNILQSRIKKISEDKKSLELAVELESILMVAVKKFIKLNEEIAEDLNFELRAINVNYFLTDNKGCPIYDVVGKDSEGVDIRVNKEIVADGKDKEHQEEIQKHKRKLINIKIYKCPTNKLPKSMPIELEPLNGYLFDYQFYKETF